VIDPRGALLTVAHITRIGSSVAHAPLAASADSRPSYKCLRRHLAAAVILLCAQALTGIRAAGGASLEYQVKAAFLYNFAKFVEWPPDAFATPDTPVGLCIMGSDPFGPDLDAIAGHQRVNGRPLSVRRLAESQPTSGCHILYLGITERHRLATVLQGLNGAPILTVGEDEDFTQMGGGLRFFLFENRVRFEINLDATNKARLKLSAKLLALARVVGKGKD
jgi:hypothetical protein